LTIVNILIIICISSISIIMSSFIAKIAKYNNGNDTEKKTEKHVRRIKMYEK